MIEKNKIEWIEHSTEGAQVYYKGVKLDISPETLQDIHHGFLITEKEAEKIISDSYQRCLRFHREQRLKELLND